MTEEVNGIESERRVHIDTDHYFNTQFDALPILIAPGQSLYGHDRREMIVANLGASVAVSLYDPVLEIGAMCSVLICQKLAELFPRFDDADQELIDLAFSPLDQMIAQMKSAGASKSRITVRLMGGADMPGDDLDLGTKNAVFVRHYIRRQELSILNDDCGGPYVRRIHFFPYDGKTVRLLLTRQDDFQKVSQFEQEFLH